METTDELVTPGCPNCVIKHLSAAVALLANARVTDLYTPMVEGTLDRELALRAAINLTESCQAYESHFDYAVGLLVLAEAVPYYDAHRRELYRNTRLLLIERGNDPGAVSTAVTQLVMGARSGIADEYFGQIYAQAHLTEALRESPESVRDAVAGVMCVDDLQRAIRDVRKEFFSDFNEGIKPVEEKGEDDMATAKKAPAKAAKKEAVPAKKAVAAKATKAACKGGKTKKK
jgi:hypothetical protein